MGLTRTSEPAIYPVTLTQAKKQTEIWDGDASHDAQLDTLIAAATDMAERKTGRALITQTWKLTLDRFPREILLPRPPAQSVSSIQYVDTDGATQTLATAEYQVATEHQPGRVVEAHNKTWPTTRNQPEAVTVTYVAGYGSAAADVPAAIRQAILTLVAHWFEQREAVTVGPASAPMQMAAAAIFRSYRVGQLYQTYHV